MGKRSQERWLGKREDRVAEAIKRKEELKVKINVALEESTKDLMKKFFSRAQLERVPTKRDSV